MVRIVALTLGGAFLVFLAGSCSSKKPQPPRPDAAAPRAKVTAEELARAVQAENALAIELFKELRAGEGSFAFCPPSIAATLAVAYAGAGGETAEELARVLHVRDLERARAHAALGMLGAKLAQSSDDVQLEMATALWAQSGYRFKPEFLQTARDSYDASVNEADFKSDAAAAQERIDRWVKKHTHDKIQHLSTELDADTRLVVTNAVYFLGRWLSPFKKELTQDAPFHTTDDREAVVPMMQQHDELRYAENDALQVLELPYASGELSMLVLLPRDPKGLAAIEEALPDKLEVWLEKLDTTKVEIFFPRFNVEKVFDLREAIGRLGAPAMFNHVAADFSNAYVADPSNPGLYISALAHQVVVDVDERGTEAAAVTELVAKAKEAVLKAPPVFRADHPFLFLVRDGRQGTILFIGRFAGP